MAASKEHLKNLNKNYKLKKTDKVTIEGKPIYVNTLTGEEHSELSMTLEYPANSGKWINVPSLLNGKVYTDKGVMALLKSGRLTPTSTHMSEQEASQEAAYRSTTLQSNTGETLKPANEIADFDPAKQAFIDENMNAFANTFPTREENPNGLFRVEPTNLDAQLNQQILNTDTASMQETVANNNNLKQLAAIMDRVNVEKEDDYYVDGSYSGRNYSFFKPKAIQYLNGNKAPYEQGPSAADQAMFDAASKARGFLNEGPSTRQSKPKPITGTAPAMDDTVDVEKGIKTNYTMADGPDRRQSNKPMFNFEYKPHMNPEQKIKDNRNLKKLTPEYGKMPGFKFVSAGTKDPEAGYWSADENSQFWKTDAGYEKAQQTWGNSGTLPNYVKRPVKKELDVNAIKKFFSSSK